REHSVLTSTPMTTRNWRSARPRTIRRAGSSRRAALELQLRLLLSRQVVRRIVRGERNDVFRVRMSSLEPWLTRLDDEWTAGCRNGAELWRRLKTAGFKGSSRVVAEWATRRRRAEVAPSCGPRKCPSSRVIARMMTIARDQLSKDDAVTIATIEAAVPAL